MKRTVNLYLDIEAIEILKARGVNISAKVSAYLESLAKTETAPSADVANLREELDKRVAEEADARALAELKNRIQPFIEYYKKQMAGDFWKNHPDKRDAWMEDTSRDLGISRDEFIKWAAREDI